MVCLDEKSHVHKIQSYPFLWIFPPNLFYLVPLQGFFFFFLFVFPFVYEGGICMLHVCVPVNVCADQIEKAQGTFYHSPSFPGQAESQQASASLLSVALPPTLGRGYKCMCSHAWFPYRGAQELSSVCHGCTVSTLDCQAPRKS